MFARWKSNTTVLVALVGLLALFSASYRLCVGQAIVPFDADAAFAPDFVLLADFTRHGKLMLWNPWLNGGLPDFAEPQVGAFSPLLLAVGALLGGVSFGFRIYFLLVWWLPGAGLFLLGRRLGAPAWASAMVGFAWTFSGFMLGHAEHTPWLYVTALLPFEILLLESALERGSWRRFAATGAVWGMSVLGGYPGLVFNNALVLVAWAVGRGLFPLTSSPWAMLPLTRRLMRISVGVFLLSVIGCAVMSPHLIGMLVDTVGVTARSGPLPRQAALGENPLGPLALLTLASPFLATLPRGNLWPQTDPSMASVYIGAPTLVLALVSLLGGHRKARWGLFAGAVLLLLVALGPILPLRGWLYDLVPFTRYYRHPAAFRGPAMVLLAVLALLGARDVFRGEVRRSRPVLISFALTAFAFVAFSLISARAGIQPTLKSRVHLGLAWLGTDLAFLFYLLSPRFPARLQTSVWAATLALAAFADGFLCEKISAIHVGDHEVIKHWRILDQGHRDSLDIGALTGSTRADYIEDGLGCCPRITAWSLVLKQPVFSGYTALRNPFHERMARQASTKVLGVGGNKTWFTTRATFAPPSEDAFALFMKRSETPRGPSLVLHSPAGFLAPERLSPAQARELEEAPPVRPLASELLSYEPTELAFRADAPADGWLLVTDRWAPGWRATINDQPAEILPADFIFRALPVKKGVNTIRMHYRPRTLPYTLPLSWGTLLIVGWLQIPKRRRLSPGVTAGNR